MESGSEPTLKSCFIFEGLMKGLLKTPCLNLLNNAENVSRNVASENLTMVDDGMERERTEGFVSRFKMPFGHLRGDGGRCCGLEKFTKYWAGYSTFRLEF
jgi:hypothetical protein